MITLRTRQQGDPISREVERYYKRLVNSICLKSGYNPERFYQEFAVVPLSNDHLALVERSLLDGRTVHSGVRIPLSSLTELLKDSGAKVHSGEYQGHGLHVYVEPHQEPCPEKRNVQDISLEDDTNQGFMYALLKAGESSLQMTPNSIQTNMCLAGMNRKRATH